MKTIQLQIIDDQDHTETTLINSKGDKFTFNPLKHEGLDSFLSGCKLASDGDLADVSICGDCEGKGYIFWQNGAAWVKSECSTCKS